MQRITPFIFWGRFALVDQNYKPPELSNIVYHWSHDVYISIEVMLQKYEQ